MTRGVVEEAERAEEGSNTESNIKMAKSPMFNEDTSKMGEFITACRLYLRTKMRGAIVEEQIQWILLYMQRGLADIWKENLLEDLESGEAEFGGGNKELVKVVEL